MRVPSTEMVSAATSADTAVFFTPVAAEVIMRADNKTSVRFCKVRSHWMPKISEERRGARREQILEGARRCFAEHGYEGATVAKLEREIGLSRGAIFNYFSSKEDLFVELVHAGQRPHVGPCGSHEGLEAVVQMVVELDPAWLSVYLELFRRVRTDPDFRARIEARNEQVVPANRERIEEAQRSGEFRDDVEPKEHRHVRQPRPERARAACEPVARSCRSTELVLGLLRDAIGARAPRDTPTRTPA